jgi:hypothetical protein
MSGIPPGKTVTGRRLALTIAVSGIALAFILALILPPDLRSRGPPSTAGSTTFDGGGGTCPNPAVTVSNAISDPPPLSVGPRSNGLTLTDATTCSSSSRSRMEPR